MGWFLFWCLVIGAFVYVAYENHEKERRIREAVESVFPPGGRAGETAPQSSRAPVVVDSSGGALFLRGDGSYSFDIVGESFYQDALGAFCGGKRDRAAELGAEAMLIHDDQNKYDNMAIRVEIDGATVGHLSRADARWYRQQLGGAGFAGVDARCRAKIVGGWAWTSGKSEGHFGVKLDI